jgi:HK97 family phage prohead protease
MGEERRAAFELRAAGTKASPRLTGYAAKFNVDSVDLGGFTERVAPGAFRRTVQGGRDVLALVHHMPHMVLGRRSAGTLTLDEDETGLRFDVALPDTQTARDLAVSVERGDIRGASFAFTVPSGGDRWEVRGDDVLRELRDVDLHEITVTATPAYPDTEVARRALQRVQRPRLVLARRFLETC